LKITVLAVILLHGCVIQITKFKVTFKIAAQVAILAKIQNGAFVYIKPIINIYNNKLGLNLTRVSAILAKIQNGAFVYHNKFKVRLSTASRCLPHCLHRIA